MSNVHDKLCETYAEFKVSIKGLRSDARNLCQLYLALQDIFLSVQRD